jgi:hypothetical protein
MMMKQSFEKRNRVKNVMKREEMMMMMMMKQSFEKRNRVKNYDETEF